MSEPISALKGSSLYKNDYTLEANSEKGILPCGAIGALGKL
jgi:hypothetical protein